VEEMIYTEQIIKLLSNHRQQHRPELPQLLTSQAIATLVQQSLPPQKDDVSLQIDAEMRELQAQGEILAGIGKKFCMAPPMVLAESETDMAGLLFRGDRAYLRLAHQALETGQPSAKLLLNPKINGFQRIRSRLKEVGIRLLTVERSVEHLPTPALPQPSMLKGAERQNPFETVAWTDSILHYLPQQGKQQSDRWSQVMRTGLADRTLLKLSTGELIWFEADKFYELTPDVAVLAMFQLDRSAPLPIAIPWDEAPGRLNLQGVNLPSNHAQLLWRLSEPEADAYRTRLFSPINRPIAREVLQHLGCVLV
jgi:hypothetical protein